MREMTRPVFRLAVVLVVSSCSALAVQQNVTSWTGTPAQLDTDFQETLAVEEQRGQAYRSGDIGALQRLLSDDYTSTNSYGEFLHRAEAIRSLRDEYLPSDQRNDDIVVRLYGSAAVVTGRAITGFVMNGRRATNHARFLRVWIKQGDGWRNVAFQGTFMLRRFSEEPQPARLLSTVDQRAPEAGVAVSHARAEIMSSERERSRALQGSNAKTLDRLLAPEYVFIDPLGREHSRAEILAGIASAGDQSRTQREEDGVEIRVHGSLAVVTGRTITRLPDQRTTSTRFTRVWVKQAEEWRLVVYQATDERARMPLPGILASTPEPVRSDP